MITSHTALPQMAGWGAESTALVDKLNWPLKWDWNMWAEVIGKAFLSG